MDDTEENPEVTELLIGRKMKDYFIPRHDAENLGKLYEKLTGCYELVSVLL